MPGVSVYGPDSVPGVTRLKLRRFAPRGSTFSNALRRGRNGQDRNHYTIGVIRKVPGGANERVAREVLVGETRASWSRDRRAVGTGLCLLRSTVGKDTAMALEVFTSWERAEAELRAMERLAPS